MARPTKEQVAKREAAKKRVEDLLGDGVQVDIKEVTAVAEKLDKLSTPTPNAGGGNKWLEDELAKATARNTELEDQLVIAKGDYAKLLGSGGVSAPVEETALLNGVNTIFNDMRNNYEGNNQTRTKYTQADVKVLLGKFIKEFPHLQRK